MNSTQIILAVITLIQVLISAFLIPFLKSKVDAATLNKILDYVRIFVTAAEQIFDRADGQAKKEWVIAQLTNLGINFDTDVVEAAIESAVLELHSELYTYDEDTPTIED